MLKAYIFDLDGTLYPRTDPLYRAMSSLTKAWFQNQLKISNDCLEGFYAQLQELYPSPLQAIKAHQLDILSYHEEVFGRLSPERFLTRDEDVRRALKSLKGKRFLVTLASTSYAVRVLDTLGLRDLFSEIHAPGPSWDTDKKIDAYCGISQAHGFAPSEVCVIGDNLLIDLQDAFVAGYKCLLVAEHQSPAITTVNAIPQISSISAIRKGLPWTNNS